MTQANRTLQAAVDRHVQETLGELMADEPMWEWVQAKLFLQRLASRTMPASGGC